MHMYTCTLKLEELLIHGACAACARVTVVSLSLSVYYQASCNMCHLHVEIRAL